jgi:lysine-N-methylase
MAKSARNRHHLHLYDKRIHTMPIPKTANALDYFEKFHCIGSACESNCCNSWVISVDEASYAKYQQLDEENGTDYFRHVTKIKDKAIISLNPEGHCPYFSEGNLCGMYKAYGEPMIPAVCKIYPRHGRVLKHADTVYISGLLSCPQVMRLAVLRKKRLRFLDIGRMPGNIPLNSTYQGGGRADGHTQVLNAIHDAFIVIAESRETSLNKRMAAMLLLSSHATKLAPLNNVEGALNLLEETLRVKTTNFADIPDLPGDMGNQFKILVLFTTKFIMLKHQGQKDSPARKKLFAIIDASFSGFGLNTLERITDEHFSRYVEAESHLLNPYFAANPHIWENLLHHYLLTTDFPFNKNNPPLYNLIYLGMLLLFCRGLLAGYALQQGKVTDADFVHVFHTIFREIDHNPQAVDTLNAFVKEIEADSIGQLYTMLAH